MALPLLLLDLLRAASWQHNVALGRHLTVHFPAGRPSPEAIDHWLNRNPFDVWPTAFAWEEVTTTFVANGGRLAGLRGALFLAHASYAALMTGLHCSAPVWQKLLEERDREDPLIEIGYLIHEVCHFRGTPEIDRELTQRIKAAPPEAKEILRLAGFAVEK